MEMLGPILASSGVFMALSWALFAPLEAWVPARDAAPRAPVSDWLMFFFNTAIGSLLALTAIAALGAAIRANLPADVLAWTGGQPIAAQLALAFVLAELWSYWAHRLSHRLSWLWRFHRLHHTIVHMRWISTHRQHPADVAWILAGANLPAFALGIDLAPLALFILFERLYAVLLHTNIDFTYGRALDRILASPRFHHWHHDAHGAGQHHNFAGMFSCLDWLFGTYRAPTEPPGEFGPGDGAG